MIYPPKRRTGLKRGKRARVLRKGGFLERTEQLFRHLEPAAADPDLDVRLCQAVKVTAAGDEKIEAFGNIEVLGRLLRGVRTVVDFDPSKAPRPSACRRAGTGPSADSLTQVGCANTATPRAALIQVMASAGAGKSRGT
ncbi:MAG: hypothetical protein KatS3mg082_2844 [Nitrospiraceae bacterium]|nr:MAG: hypothetical protein KatS3mg082_2844 [Nitrospiraceae bacterium]